jgi:acyl-coenzyme A synthetase/AMP-(fatty) acid ligase
MTTTYPLICHDRTEAVLGFHEGRPVSAGAFLADAARLASALPPRRHMVNLCVDRYRFTVAFAAALMREQVSLMPPNEAPGTLNQLADEFPDLYCLHDDASAISSLPALAYPPRRDADAAVPPIPVFAAQQEAVVLFTSGSTGRPTPQAKRWGSLVRGSRAAGKLLGISAIPGATIIGTVPQQHSYGLESTVLLALQHGLALQGARLFYPADIVACLTETPRPRILVTTPIHLRAILADESALPPLDLIVSATAPLSLRLAVEAERRFQCRLVEIYGCSEAGQLAVRRSTETETWQCLGTIRLHQDDAGTWASEEAGESAVLLNDVIELRGPDRFLLHGRTADLVNVAGKRTSLAHLNYHLNSIAGVTDGIFIMPEEEGDGTTRLTAFAVAPQLSAEAIVAALRERIDAAFIPRPLLIVPSLPRNPLGKLPREAIRRLAAELSR